MNLIGAPIFTNSFADFGTATNIAGARDVKVVTAGGVSYAVVAGAFDSGFTVFRIGADMSLTPTGSGTVSGVTNLEIVQTGGATILVFVGSSRLQTFLLNTAAGPSQGTVTAGQTLLNSPQPGDPTDGQNVLNSVERLGSITIGSSTYVLVPAWSSQSIAAFRVNGDGTLTRTSVVTDAENINLTLNGAAGVATWKVGAKSFVFVGSSTETGISSFEISATGVLTFVGSVLGPSSPRDLTAVNMNGRDFLIASYTGSGQLQVFSIGANGQLTPASTTPNSLGAGLFPGALASFSVGGVSFVAVTASGSDAIALMSVDDGNNLRIVNTISDASLLDGVRSVSMFTVNGRFYLFAAAQNSSCVSIYEIAGGSDPVVGTAENDIILGLTDEDYLLGMGGDDILRGGTGDDVLAGGVGNDTLEGSDGLDVLTGGRGDDILRGGLGADILNGGLGFDMADYTGSTAVNVNLATLAVSGGHAVGDTFNSIEGIIGSVGADQLRGNAIANRIFGADGNDQVFGEAGNDTLRGDAGNDTVNGGIGNDSLLGGTGDDSLVGDVGNDTIAGGTGNDRALGSGGDDRLLGEAGADTLDGGDGNDTLTGGTEADVFAFGDNFGNDQIADFAVAEDRISFAANSLINSFADVQARAIGFAGNTIISVGEQGASILITGVLPNQLTADNFIF